MGLDIPDELSVDLGGKRAENRTQHPGVYILRKRRVPARRLSGPLGNQERCPSDGRAPRCMGAVSCIPCRGGSGETRPGWELVGLVLWRSRNEKLCSH